MDVWLFYVSVLSDIRFGRCFAVSVLSDIEFGRCLAVLFLLVAIWY